METYRIEHLTFSYPGQEKPVLNEISLAIEQGEFVTLCGPSGCGKTTLLRQLKPVLAPHGSRSGRICLEGVPLKELDQRTQSARIGFVLQSPENQIVTDKVWHELAFGLESLGCDTPTIRRRVAEMASFFGIQTWFYRDVSKLSGGQKQLLNLAAVMALQPSVLILDEPTSQLDPIAAADFLATVGKINRELGVTVILTEHRLEDALPLSDRVVVLDGGSVIADGTPQAVGQELKLRNHSMFFAMPAPMRIWAGVENGLDCPVTVRDGRVWLDAFQRSHPLREVSFEEPVLPEENAIELDEVWFRYERELPDVVKGLRLGVPKGSLYALVGGNGTGKTTALSLIGGIRKPYRGEVRLEGRPMDSIPDSEKFNGLLGVLPQNPQALFVKKTVRLDLYEMMEGRGLPQAEQDRRVAEVASLCELSELMERHPYDLSGGEQQRAALAKVLLLEPRILLLDEPTKGMDAYFKEKFARILKRLTQKGTTVLMVSHDVEFCAQYATRCAMFFDGNIVSEGEPHAFFSGNSFYTTAANRMARHRLPDAVTAEDVIVSCGGQEEIREQESVRAKIASLPAAEGREKCPKRAKWRLPAAAVLFACCAGLAAWLLPRMEEAGFSDMLPTAGQRGGWNYVLWILVLIGGLAGAFALIGAGRGKKADVPRPLRQKLPKRTVMASVLVLLLVPLTIFAGVYFLDDRKYYFISLLVLIETMLPFALVFEGRKPQARELVVIAVLCAIAVAGRAAFFMLPQFKPVAALVIIAAVAFGGETGFLVGAVSMLVSNLFYGQGPWTPWQMFAMGMIGFLAGVLFRRGWLGRTRPALCLYGFLSTLVIYGGIMNPASLLTFQSNPTWEMLLSYYAAGLPFDFIHAASTAFFLGIAAPAMLEKLDRIKIKYGLIR